MSAVSSRVVSASVRPAAARPTARRGARVVAQAQHRDIPAALKTASIVTVSNIIMAMPASAEAGKLFDFNLTLPVMMGQFLALMVFLDKTWFGPVGKALDERDEMIRSKLSSVKDNSDALNKLQEDAEALLKAARAEAQARIAEAKSTTQAACDEQLAATKAKVDRELEQALAQLNAEREEALKGLDASVQKLADQILGRILPEGVKA
ncbi:unnamed protein product [Pedinophyceae sp. YPF-701]|nr:unnamed protein product [Pedinophyceae sp. YPF-701]